MSAADSLPPLTGWYDGSQEPVRIGVYGRLHPGGDKDYSRWDGLCWYMGRRTVDGAAAVTVTSAWNDSYALPWRGLTREVKP